MSGKETTTSEQSAPDTEYGYLIYLLRCGIHKDIPQPPSEGVAFRKVYEYAMEHDVANIAFYALERSEQKLDMELYKKWRMRRDLALVRDMNQDFARQELVQVFEKQGIRFKELQGTALKKLYPASDYRTMSDLDFIVEPSRLGDCEGILRDLGYRCKYQGDYEIDGFRKPDIYVELHTEYFSEVAEYATAMGELVFSAERSEQEDLTELYLYNVFHIAKHYFASGCGIRRVLDLYFLNQRYGHKIHGEQVEQALKEVGLLSFADNLSALASLWFGDPDENGTSGEMAEYIFDSGLHGKRETFINGKIRHMGQGEKITFGSRINYIFARLFPGLPVMERKFPVLKKRKILLPLYWVYRIFRMIFGKNRNASVLDLKLILSAEKDHKS